MTGRKCEKLVAELAAGRKNAIAELYEIAGRQMFAIAYNVLFDYQLSEDAIQESLVNIMNNANKLSVPKAAYSWMLTIVRNTALDILRSRKKECAIEDEDISVIAAKNMAEISENHIDVHNALAKLDEENRQIVLLKGTMGFSHKEISKILNISEAACQKRYQRAIKELRTYLA